MAHLVPPEKFVSALLHATYAMVRNSDAAVTNRQVFIDDFFPIRYPDRGCRRLPGCFRFRSIHLKIVIIH